MLLDTKLLSVILPLNLLISFLFSSTCLAANVFRVGPGEPYSTVAAAASVAADGDTIEIAAGVYLDDIIVWRRNNLTIKGVGGKAHIKGTYVIPYQSGNDLANGKGLWVTVGKNITIENIEFSGAKVKDGNGAGIRIEGADLTIRNCYFHDNENGVLGGQGRLTIERSEFAYNGAGDGYTHNMYIVGASSFTLKNSYSHHAKIGHNVKTRAAENFILYNRIMDESSGTSSYIIDVPNGGKTYIIGNLLQQGPGASNSAIVSYAAEGAKNPIQNLSVINNTFVNDRGSGYFLSISGTPTQAIYNNLFVYNGSLGFSGGKGNIATSTPNFVNIAGYTYHQTASTPGIDQGVLLGSVLSYPLTPTEQYIHPSSSEVRRQVGSTIDVGAYEFSIKNIKSLPPSNLRLK